MTSLYKLHIADVSGALDAGSYIRDVGYGTFPTSFQRDLREISDVLPQKNDDQSGAHAIGGENVGLDTDESLWSYDGRWIFQIGKLYLKPGLRLVSSRVNSENMK